jgi:hypothetical protein
MIKDGDAAATVRPEHPPPGRSGSPSR